MSRKNCYLISMCLGWLAAADSLVIGLYIITTCVSLQNFPGIERLLKEAYVATTLTAVLALVMALSSYHLWKKHTRRPSITNLSAGMLLTFVYLYFEFLSQPPLLSWLNPWGYFLLAPAIMSGIIGILADSSR